MKFDWLLLMTISTCVIVGALVVFFDLTVAMWMMI